MRKLAQRRRLADYYKFITKKKKFNRKDLSRIGEVTIVQVSADLIALREDYPQLNFFYDRASRVFLLPRD